MVSYRIIDLTHRLMPGEEQYQLEVRERLADRGGGRKGPTGDIQSEVFFWSHVGTHAEASLHFYAGGKDTSDFSLDHFVGPAIRLDFRQKGTSEPITLEDFQRVGDQAGGIRVGDRVFMWQGRDQLYRTKASHDRPYVSEDAAAWLIQDRKIKVLGTDSSGFEVRGERATAHPNHHLFFKAGTDVPVIECMRNLGEIPSDRFFFVGMPLPVKGLDASPIRAVAIVPEGPDQQGTLAELLGL
ncbi:MAG: cyclase family protein [Chloroflexota bacterium]